MVESFIDDGAIRGINKKIKDASRISNKEIELSVELSSKNAWESSLITCLDKIPFHYIGKGEQCIVKTKLALSHRKSQEANILLLEEPENHLSHTKLNQLIHDIKDSADEKQMIICTHSSFVANKLGLSSMILLHDSRTVTFEDLKEDTKRFFEKLAGYDTLRLILCEKAILVEGDSDELVVQKAYKDKNRGQSPIEGGIDVISVGTSFLRFLEIAKKVGKPVVVVTDNDGDPKAVRRKYEEYMDAASTQIKICFDEEVDSGDIKDFNYNTLEPKLVKANNLEILNGVFKKEYETLDDLHKYMKNNKTECALEIFKTEKTIEFPRYILDAIE
jgi:putative ATP-dependent endonuclease of OLD family